MKNGLSPRQAPLTLRQAALQAGQDIKTFKGVTDVLNGTGMDLRVAGNRGIPRYDPERLAQWLRVQKGRHERPEQGPVPVKISAVWNGVQWTVGDPERSVSVSGPRLATVQRSLAERIARLLRTSSDRIRFGIDFAVDSPAVRSWTEADQLKLRAHKLLNESVRKRQEAITALVNEGMTTPEIAEVFGMSSQRIRQIVADAKPN